MYRSIDIVVTSVTTTTDALGDTATVETSATVTDVLFAPRSSNERTDPRAPAVITGGTIYKQGPGLVVNADDRITIANVSPIIDGEWQVEGVPGFWGRGTEVAVTRWSNG